jgi:hypothetical protein
LAIAEPIAPAETMAMAGIDVEVGAGSSVVVTGGIGRFGDVVRIYGFDVHRSRGLHCGGPYYGYFCF